MSFKFYKQRDSMDCGPTCLKMISMHYGYDYDLEYLRKICSTSRDGTSLYSLKIASETIGLNSEGVKTSFENLKNKISLPVIAYWKQDHYIVVYKIKNKCIYVADPAHGLLKYNFEEFKNLWFNSSETEGLLLLFNSNNTNTNSKTKKRDNKDFALLFKHLVYHKKLVIQLLLGLLIISFLQLLFPFLMQKIVDIGIQNHDLKFIYLVLLAQLMIFFGRTFVEVLRSYVLMYISGYINISLVSEFFVKLMKLPIRFFDIKLTGDIIQRIGDHQRVERFLTGASLNSLFSVFNLLIFSFVLGWYSLLIFSVFIIGSLFYFIWVMFFLKRREELDYKRFQEAGKNHSKVIELINGMQEIKLHNAEQKKLWQWENIQAQMFNTNKKSVSLTQLQKSGSGLINELKNIIITFLSAKLVIENNITLGTMLSISYIIGQLNIPILELVNIAQQWQDAKLSFERLNEIHRKKDEDFLEKNLKPVTRLEKEITFKNVFFKYESFNEKYVLNDISFNIPKNKVTAIVGSSGSGKTTLMKLLLKFYDPLLGEIEVDSFKMRDIYSKSWRNMCGCVMQDGYIFNDTIANNIAIGDEQVNLEKLNHALHVANIEDFINDLPQGYNSKIGIEGLGISSGQKQRILIARAVYKNPEILFFDEATSALDSKNEKIIIKNLMEFFKNKTVVVIAHRLSTVRNADQILVLENGKIVEYGKHTELITLKGSYYDLIKNQLELGD